MLQRILRLRVITLLFCCGCTSPFPFRGHPFQPKPGDILFQDADVGSLSEAVENITTPGWRGTVFSHMGLAIVDDQGQMAVVESLQGTPSGVRITPLSSFLERSLDAKGRPKVIVGRFYPPYHRLIPAAIHEAKQLIGKPYDPYFSLNNDAYYGSELIYEAFRLANHGTPLFHLRTVSFINPDTHEIYPFWDNWSFQHGKKAPPELQIVDPGSMSTSSKLRIVHVYGIPYFRKNL